LIAFLGLSLFIIFVFGNLTLETLNNVGDYSERTTKELGKNATEDSASALRELGQKNIEQKTTDVARQMEIYILFHVSSVKE